MSKFSNLTTRTYNSIVELAEYLQGEPYAASHGDASRDTSNWDWDLGYRYEDALAVALDGGWWEEGARKMTSAQIKAANFMRETTEVELEYDVTGRYLDMDEYLSGSPECWVLPEEQEREVRVIRVGFSAFMCCDVPADQAVNRGAALLTVIDAIESNGDRVELWAGFHQKSGHEWTDGRILIKDASDDWSPSSVAFAMCHPAFSRRLGFRWLEAHDDTSRMTHGGYGMGLTNKEMDNTYDVYFDYFQSGSQWSSVERAVQSISNSFNTQLKESAQHAQAA